MGKRTVFVDSPEPEDDDVKPDLTDLQEPSASNEEPNDLNAQNITSMARDFLNKAKSITKRSNMDNELSTFIRKSIRIIEWYQQNWNAVDSRAQIEHAKNENAPDEDPNNDINRVLQVNRRRQNSFNNVSHDKDQLLMANVFRDAMGKFMESALEAMLEKTRKKDRLLEVPEPNLENEVVSQQQTSTRQRVNSTNQQSTTGPAMNEAAKNEESSTPSVELPTLTIIQYDENEKKEFISRDRLDDRNSRATAPWHDKRPTESRHQSRPTGRWNTVANRSRSSRFDARNDRRSRSPLRSYSRPYDSKHQDSKKNQNTNIERNDLQHFDDDPPPRFFGISTLYPRPQVPSDRPAPSTQKPETSKEVPTTFDKIVPSTSNQPKHALKNGNTAVGTKTKSPNKPTGRSTSCIRPPRNPQPSVFHQPSSSNHQPTSFIANSSRPTNLQSEQSNRVAKLQQSTCSPQSTNSRSTTTFSKSTVNSTSSRTSKSRQSNERPPRQQPKFSKPRPLVSLSPPPQTEPSTAATSQFSESIASDESEDDENPSAQEQQIIFQAVERMNNATSSEERADVIAHLRQKNLFGKFLKFRRVK
ncbi:hypothetical protein M3Y94_00739000 [Aphelenchoides besseyi]|nr:hypothetical protein M3Y94_00739000 [Aphelenchoides besseyi]KAI6231963.1 hypothetical protein M3Y95_00436900 [Aphelenchoides besseyi]